jgi:hypothetical protein
MLAGKTGLKAIAYASKMSRSIPRQGFLHSDKGLPEESTHHPSGRRGIARLAGRRAEGARPKQGPG